MVGLNTLVGKRYKILAQIGKGGMSTVYLAMDSSLNKQWAIKEIRSASDPVQRDLVIKSLTVEANMIKRFDHPAIPRIVDLIEEKGSLFVVMDYVEGQTLASLLKKEGPQSEEDVVDWGHPAVRCARLSAPPQASGDLPRYEALECDADP